MTDETAANGNLKQAIPFFWVADMQKSLRFYADGVGFSMTRKWLVEGEVRWCLLQRGDVELMLQQRAQRPEAMVGEGVSICILCDDALSLYRELRSRGIEVSRPFVGNGLWVVTIRDPDGFRIDFESPADAPEETEFSEAEHGLDQKVDA